jgi:hypothetical protein
VRVADAGDEIGRPGPAGAEAHPDGAPLLGLFDGGRSARVAVGHVAGALLVADQHVVQPRELRQDVVERHDGAAG